MISSIVEHNGVRSRQQDFERLKFDYDTLASKAFEQLLKSGTASHDLYTHFAQQNESDPSVKELWDQATSVPPWVDWAQLRRGQIVFNRYIIPIALGFAFQGFAGEIAAAVGPAEVLVRAGGLSSRNIHHRVTQTLQWLMEVTESVASIQPGGKGHASTIRVRLLHARIRRRISKAARSQPEYYDFDRHGIPINTHDTILTLAFFCCKPIWVQLPRLWVYPRGSEIEDFVALYRYLAHLLGLPSEHFASADIAKQTMDALDREEKVQREASRQITHAFLDAFADQAPYNLSQGFLWAGIRTMNLTSTCDNLKIPEAGIAHRLTFLSLKASVALLTATQTRVPLLDAALQKYLRDKVGLILSQRQSSSDQSLTDFKYPTASSHKKRRPVVERCGRLELPWVKRPLELILMLLLVVAAILAMAVVIAAINICSLGWKTLAR